MSEHTFQMINLGPAVLGGWDVSGGRSDDVRRGEARMAIAMERHSQQLIVPVDGLKIGKVTLAIIGAAQPD